MIECLAKIGIDDKDLQIMTKLYWEQTAALRTEHGIATDFNIKHGLRQGFVLSPNLFNLYTDRVFRELEDLRGVSIGGVNISNLRYADDTSLIAEGITDLQDLVSTVNEKGKPYGMAMNISKTKAMVVNRKDTVPEKTSV